MKGLGQKLQVFFMYLDWVFCKRLANEIKAKSLGKIKQRIKKLYGKTLKQKLHFEHKISRQITNENNILVFEDLT